MNIDTQQQQIDHLTATGVIEDVSIDEAARMGAFSETAMPIEDVLAAAAEDEANG